MAKLTSKPKVKPNAKAKVIKSPQQRADDTRRKKLHNKVVNIFKNMGFEYLNTDGIHKEFNGQKGELDNVFLFENIILMVEETISEQDKNHIKKKDYFFGKIVSEFPIFIDWLKKDYSKSFFKFDDYPVKQYKFFYVYISDNIIDRTTKTNFEKLIFIDNQTLEYFSSISSSIKYSSKYELFKFLKLDISDIGNPDSGTRLTKIETAVIMPETASGFPPGVQVLTFVMKAKELMECAYVLRKDSWDQTIGLYQRLIDKKKIENIRKFLSKEKRTFIDSIIVSLPFDTSFSQKDPITQIESPIDIFDTNQFSNISMTIPYKINTIGVIDGQHRIYSHYEGNDPLEASINSLRNRRHLFVTGLFFDKTKFSDTTKRKLESEIFLQINNEQKKVNTALLQYIKSLNDPYSSIGIGNNVISYLNTIKPFLGYFSDSALTTGGIKTPSILQYGLQSLVALDADNITLYKYWLSSGKNTIVNDDQALGEYIEYCADNLSTFFCAVKDKYKNDWKIKDKKGGILSSTTIVAFLRSYKTSLDIYGGPQDFLFYQNKLKNLDVNFNNYVSSHWNQLALVIDDLCWK